MRPEHIRVLACLNCHGDLLLTLGAADQDGHVITGRLSCGGCGAEYSVRDGVPLFGPDALQESVQETVSAFGYQWHRSESSMSTARFSAPETFLDFIRPVEREWFRNKVVLDGGCGAGRFLLASVTFGAALVVGIDLSSSVEVAFAKTRHLENVLIVQGDLLRLPLKRTFDYAFSVGVLHHTSDPRGAFLEMASKVVPGGGVSAWVYGAENNEWVRRVITPLRSVTSRLPRSLLLVLAYVTAVPLTLVLKLVYGPLSKSPSGRSVGKHLFYFDYLAFLSQFGYRDHVLIVFDHAVPAIAEYIPRRVFEEWFRAAGLERVNISARAANSWRGFGLVPA